MQCNALNYMEISNNPKILSPSLVCIPHKGDGEKLFENARDYFANYKMHHGTFILRNRLGDRIIPGMNIMGKTNFILKVSIDSLLG